MKKTILGLMALVVLATSCKKEDTEQAQPVTTEAVMGAYNITKVEATISGIRGDMTAQWYSDNGMGECAKDDITTFQSNGVYDVSEGNIACDPVNETSGTWSVSNGAMQVDGEPVEVEFFSGRTLRMALAYNGTDKIIYTYTRK